MAFNLFYRLNILNLFPIRTVEDHLCCKRVPKTCCRRFWENLDRSFALEFHIVYNTYTKDFGPKAPTPAALKQPTHAQKLHIKNVKLLVRV